MDERLRRVLRDARERLEAADRARHEPIAVVGMGGRLPGAATLEDFWTVLRDGRDLVAPMPAARDALVGDRWQGVPPYLREAGWLDAVETFDHQLFAMSSDEATSLDPQQRLLLEATWSALEDACVAPAALQGSRTGVFIGISNADFAQRTVRASRDAVDAYGLTGVGLSLAPGRIAYLLGLRGPALAVDTACSSSLVALHLAVESLRRGECDWALVGGVQIILEPHIALGLDRMAALSPRARCRAFDAGADGFVRGEGALMTLLRRGGEAGREGDPVRALVLGSAVNQDGASSGLTAPNGQAQREVIRAALEAARVTPAEVQVLEAHGTGTALGDPIELGALADVFADRASPLHLGSVKTNIGHLEAAAGLAGLARVILSLEHEALPPHLHFETPTPRVDWTRLPVDVPVTTAAWPRGTVRRIAGLSSFGFSGTNAHVVIAEPTAVTRGADAVGHEPWPLVVPLSAQTAEALESLTTRWQTGVAAQPLEGIAATAIHGRATLPHRRVVIAETTVELCEALQARAGVTGTAMESRPVVLAVDGSAPASGVLDEWCRRVPAMESARQAASTTATASQDGGITWAAIGCRLLRLLGAEPLGVIAGEGVDARALAAAVDLPLVSEAPPTAVVVSLPAATGDSASAWRALLTRLAEAWVCGAELRWQALAPPASARVRLPLYPFAPHVFWPVAALVAPESQAGPAVGPQPPRVALTHDEILDRLQDMLAQTGAADDGPIPIDANLFTLGIDSIMLIQVRGLVAREFGVELDLAKFYDETSTLDRLASWIAARQTTGAAIAESLRVAAPATTPAAQPAAARPGSLPNRPGRAASAEVAAAQRAYLETFAPRYIARTAASRAHVARHRPHLATSRNLAGFRADWKEIVYQIVGGEGRGARLVDADGREYRDFTMGFGAALLGHNPDVVRAALARELTRGFALGPLSDLAGDAAEAVTRLTGVDRVAFFNTGSEAVMNAVRIARTVTQRSRLVIFDGAYHGTFDGVLALDLDGESVPISPGTTRGMVEDVRMLRYGDPASLDIIAREAGTLAGVLVEPVQSRHPDLQPEWFLRELRALTAAHDVPLIFDEMITGFRCHPGGVQQRWGIAADLVTYGKVLGGGLPIGAVAGSRRYLDAVDGGVWQYGDASLPTAATTFTSGTFCNHPLSMAASLAVLRELERTGPGLQREIDRRTARLCERLNDACAAEGFPLRMVWFSSLFRFVFEADLELLFFHLLERGFYVWEGRNCFLSAAHTDDDVDAFVDAVLDSLRQMRAGGLFTERPASVATRLGDVPATRDEAAAPAQRRVALVQEAVESDAAWHLHDARVLDGPLDLARLQRAFETVVARHESLRTGFVWRDGELRQQVHPHVPSRIVVVERPDGDPVAVARSLLRPFDLARPPLLRLSVARLGDERWLLVSDAHHLVCDGASLAIVIEELLRAYGGESLPPVAQYPAFAAQHLARLTGPDGERLARYWRGVFPTTPPALTLPTDSPRPLALDTAGAALRAEVPPDVVAQLRALARASGATVYAVLLAAYQTWLARMAGADDVVIGVPVAGRPEPEFSRAVGMFVATVPVRLAYAPADPVAAVVARVARTLWSAVEHADYPFEHLVESLGGARHPGRQPLFDTMFEFETGPAGDPTLDGRSLRPVTLDDGTAMFDLDIELRLEGERLWLTFKYRTSLWRPATARDWCDSFQALLAAFGSDPDAPCGRVPMLTGERRRVLLDAVNETTVALDHTAVHDLVRARAAGSPEAVALTTGEGTITYAALWTLSGRLAAALAAAGAGPERAVAIVARRSPVAVAAALGALRGGACYAPLDPATPVERLNALLAVLAPVAVVADPDLARILSLPDGARLLISDGVEAESASLPEVGAEPVVHPDQAAYVLFTSGSTGTPKGVVISHRAFSNHVAWYVRQFGISAADVFVQKTICTFDTSLTEIYAALTTGARLVLPADHVHQDPAAIAALIRDQALTVLEDVPAFADLLVAEPAMAQARLRWHNPGGEALSSALATRAAAATGARIANLYGPTEAAVDALCEVWDGTEHGGWVPIGRPVDNTTAYVLDAVLEPVPTGVVGDLYVGGCQLARGYLEQPGLTAHRFIPNPFGPPGARLYRTGDRAFRLADGRVVYAGRSDQQIKVRGQRIEPGEIEAALRACPGVTEAVAGLWTRPDGAPALVAWVHPAAPGDWRTRLRRRLPAAMVPAQVVSVAAWPTLSSGKIDRRALPSPTVDLGSDAGTVAPDTDAFTPTEAAIAAVFGDVLGVAAIGRHDDFFLLGGHSLLAARAVARLRQRLARDLPLRLLFEHPTIETLAGAIDRHAIGVPLVATPDADSYPLTGVQRGVWLACQQRGESAGYVMAEAYECEGVFDTRAFATGLSLVIARHEALRTRFVTVDGESRQQVRPPEDVPVHSAASAADLQAQLEAPFDLESDLLVRAVVCRVAPTRHLIGLAIHHLVFDAWSSAVLAEDLREAYARVRQGDRTPLPPLPLQYRDVAVREARRREAGGEHRDRQYWSDALAGLQPRPELPLDRPRPARVTTAGGELTAVMEASLVAALDAWVSTAGASRLAGLIAAVHLWEHVRSGVTDSVVGTVSAGRAERAVEPLIGFFVNTLAVRTRVEADQRVGALLDAVRSALTGAVAHQDYPLDRIVSDLAPDRVAGRHPLFDVVVNMLDATMAEAGLADGAWPDARMRRLPLPLTDAKFDLMLVASPSRDGRRLDLSLEYRADLFDPAGAKRWLDEVCAIVTWVTSHPTATISAFVRAWQQRPATQVALVWQGPTPALPEADVWTQFERIALERPEATGILDGGRVVTYAALRRRALQWATHLVSAGVKPGDTVGVLGERSAATVEVLLGAVAAGAVYVPLDPAAPDAHVQWVVDDALLRVVVADRPVPSIAGRARVLRMDVDPFERAALVERARARRVTGDWPVYVMYTSGSTGRPKGIVVPHRAVTRLVHGGVGVPLGPETRVAMASSPAFDASTFELWGALLHGGTLVVIPREVLLDPAQLSARLAETPVDVLWLTAGVFHALVSQAPETLLPVPYLMAGGDVVRAQAVRALADHGHCGRVINGYGPTENTTFTTTFDTSAWRSRNQDSVPIGRPVGHTEVYVVNAQGHLAAVGEAGELWTGGLGLAHGYLARPGLTAERFVPHPFSTTPGARLYRTGDRVCWREDRTLEFLGRLDRQVKVRGFRVEPGEVEAALRTLPGIRAAVVDARPGPGGDRRLIAWVEEATPGAAASARECLRDTLPPYLVPSIISVVTAWPLTTNGKVAIDALAEPDEDERLHARTTDAAGADSSALSVLREVWASVLGRADVGPDDNFFALGGDSIQAIQVVTRAAERGITLRVQRLFEYQSLAALAAVVARETAISADAGRSPAGPIDATAITRQFLRQSHPAPETVTQSVRLRLHRDAALLPAALEAVVAHHDAFRLQVSPAEGGHQLALREVGRPVPVLSGDEAPVDLDPSAGRVAWARWVEGAGERGAHVDIVLHHLIVDGVSWRVLVADLESAVRQLSAGGPVHLPAVPTGLAAVGRWQVEAAARAAGDRTVTAYWQSVVQVPAMIAVDDATAPNLVADETSVVTVLDGETTARLDAALTAQGLTFESALIGAVARACAANSAAFRLDVEGHGRTMSGAPDLSRTVGWLTALYPLALQCPTAVDPAAWTRAAADAVRRTPDGGVTYGLLTEVARVPALREAPPSAVVVNYHGDVGHESDVCTLVATDSGPAEDGRARRRHEVEVTAERRPDGLHVRWTAASPRIAAARLARWASAVIEALRWQTAGADEAADASLVFDDLVHPE